MINIVALALVLFTNTCFSNNNIEVSLDSHNLVAKPLYLDLGGEAEFELKALVTSVEDSRNPSEPRDLVMVNFLSELKTNDNCRSSNSVMIVEKKALECLSFLTYGLSSEGCVEEITLHLPSAYFASITSDNCLKVEDGKISANLQESKSGITLNIFKQSA